MKAVSHDLLKTVTFELALKESVIIYSDIDLSRTLCREFVEKETPKRE